MAKISTTNMMIKWNFLFFLNTLNFEWNFLIQERERELAIKVSYSCTHIYIYLEYGRYIGTGLAQRMCEFIPEVKGSAASFHGKMKYMVWGGWSSWPKNKKNSHFLFTESFIRYLSINITFSKMYVVQFNTKGFHWN